MCVCQCVCVPEFVSLCCVCVCVCAGVCTAGKSKGREERWGSVASALCCQWRQLVLSVDGG